MKIKILILCSLIFSSEFTYSQWNKKSEKNKTKLVLSDGERKKFDHNFFEALKQKHLENYEGKIAEKSSSNNKFLTFTFEYYANSPSEVIDIYKGLEFIDNIISL